MELAIAEPFLVPVDLNVYPTYAVIVEYPIDLSTIKARFENRFYRRVTAAQFDMRHLATNAEKFNERHSVIVKHARILTELCLRIIKWERSALRRHQSHRDFFQTMHQQPGRHRRLPPAGGQLRLHRHGSRRRDIAVEQQDAALAAHQVLEARQRLEVRGEDPVPGDLGLRGLGPVQDSRQQPQIHR
jgi:hypothetical protein